MTWAVYDTKTLFCYSTARMKPDAKVKLAVQRRWCKKLGWSADDVDCIQLVKLCNLKTWKALRKTY